MAVRLCTTCALHRPNVASCYAGGTVAGSFYRVLVDHETSALWRTVRLAAALYALTSCVQGVTRWLSELVAAR